MRIRRAALAMALVMGVLTPGFAKSACDHVTLDWIKAQAPVPEDVRIVHTNDQHSMCEVVLSIEGNLVPVYAGKEFVVAGQMFSKGASVTGQTMEGLSQIAEQERQLAQEKEALKVEKRKLFFKENISKLEELVFASFGPGSAKGFIYVITDPNCSHCKDMIPKLEELSFEAKKTLKVIIYPVLGTQSRDMAARAICEKYDYEAYKSIQPSEEKISCEEADQQIQKTMDLFRAPGLSFVPVVVGQDGSWVVEGNDICGVRTQLGLKPQEGEEGAAGGCAPSETN